MLWSAGCKASACGSSSNSWPRGTLLVVDDKPDPRLVGTITEWGVPHLVGDPRLPRTLTEAGIEGATALVCTETDDLVTLASALTARAMRSDVLIVVQLRNPAVGRALADLDITVIDVAAVAAPSMVEACLGTGAHALELDGLPFVLARVVVHDGGTLRELYGDLAPVAVVQAPRAGEETVVVCPSRDIQVMTGDMVTLFGTSDDLLRQGVSLSRMRDAQAAAAPRAVGARQPRLPPPASQPNRPRRPLRQAGSTLRTPLDRRLRLTPTALAALTVASSAVLTLTYREPSGDGTSVLDAVYFTVETVGTIGYGDFSFREQDPWLRVFAVALMVVGTALVSLFFAFLTNFLVSRQLEEVLGLRRLTRMSGHVVVAGVGSIGVRVIEALRAAGIEVGVVDSDPLNRYLAQVRAWDVPLLIADATQPGTLEQLQLGTARAIAVLTSDDLTNLEIGLAARDHIGDRSHEVPVVMRLFDRDLAVSIRRNFGFGHVRSTASLAAPWFVGAALGLEVRGTFYAAGTPLLLAQMSVVPFGGLDGLALQDLVAEARVLAIRRDGTLQSAPRRDTRMAGGDVAFVVGPYEELL